MRVSGACAGDPGLCAVDELIPFKDEGEAEATREPRGHSGGGGGGAAGGGGGDLAEIKSSLLRETELPAQLGRQCLDSPTPFLDQTRVFSHKGTLWDVYDQGQSYPRMHYPGCIVLPSDPYGCLSPPVATTTVHPLTPLITYSDQRFPSNLSQTTAVVSQRCSGADVLALYAGNSVGVSPQMGAPLSWFSQHVVAGVPGSHDAPRVPSQLKAETLQTAAGADRSKAACARRPHVKKPLNAFMLFMKEMRANVAAESTLKESSAINQILGRRWHALSHEEQAKYYELARKERQLHMQLYPGWSARENYGRRKKRNREKVQESVTGHHHGVCSPCKTRTLNSSPYQRVEAC